MLQMQAQMLNQLICSLAHYYRSIAVPICMLHILHVNVHLSQEVKNKLVIQTYCKWLNNIAQIFFYCMYIFLPLQDGCQVHTNPCPAQLQDS